MRHDRAYLRAKNWSKAIRKREIDRAIGPYSRYQDYYDNLHQYSKNKIFCSCSLCSEKTKNKGKRRQISWSPSYNPTAAEQRKVDSMNIQVQELEEEND